MALVLSPEPGIYSGSNITLNINKTSDVAEYMVSMNGIPPVLAKYIAYDNLTPQNPFIATVEDGLGNVLLDGGFPKWYNDNCSDAWTTYAHLSPTYKYLYDAIDFVSNKTKVGSGNKNILILGDQEPAYNYSIKDAGSGRGGFKKSLDKVCTIKGYTPTYRTLSDYVGNILNTSYGELDQYCCVLFFSTNWTNAKLITDTCIQSLIAYRENGNGIFFITDHGDRILANTYDAVNTDNYGFYRTANFVVANFGCFFTGDFNRTPVNVGYLRANYGAHALWNNLLDSDYIYAGGSESKVVITQYPIYTGAHTEVITTNGYNNVKFLLKYTDGTLRSVSYTYGLNVPEVIYFLDSNNVDIPTFRKDTFLKRQPANFRVNYTGDATGLIKFNGTPIGTFVYKKATGLTTKNLYPGVSNNLKIRGDELFSIQMITPITYSKNLNWHFRVPDFSLRTSRVINQINQLEFRNNETTSPIRNVSRLLTNKSLPTRHQDKGFIYHRIHDYFFDIDQPEVFDSALASPVVEALIYEDQSQLDFELINRKPQTPLSIFNSWGRFDGENYYDNKDTASGNAAAWLYNSTTGAVEMPSNVEPTNGFVSNLLYDNYDFEATVTSTNNDDDSIGLVAAFVRENNVNYYICIVANMGGFSPQPAGGLGIYFNYIRSANYYPLYNGTITTSPSPTGWSGKSVKLRIKREGDVIKFWNSNTDSTTLTVDPQFTLDLNTDPNLLRFKGKKKYGYMTLSQPYGSYKNISFTGGLENLLINANTREVYKYSDVSQGWELTSINIVTKYGSGVLIYNPEQTIDSLKKLYKFTTTTMSSYGPFTEHTSTAGLVFDKSLVFVNAIGTFVAPTSFKIKKIWLEYETDIQRDIVYDLDFIITGQVAAFANPTIYNLNRAIVLTTNNEMYKLTESGTKYIFDSVTSFKYIDYNSVP